MKQIIVTIDDKGNVSMEGEGFKGGVCHKFMAIFENALGKLRKIKNKPDVFKKERVGCVNH